MKKSFLIAILSTFLFSQNSLATNIGIIDIDKIFAESTALIDIQKKIDAKGLSYENEVSKKQKQLEAEQKRIEEKKDTLSQEAFDKEAKNFEAKVEDLKTYIDRKQNSLKKATIDAMGKVNDKLKDIVKDIAKEKQLDLVILNSQTFYSKDEYDITAEALSALNKKLTKVEVKFE